MKAIPYPDTAAVSVIGDGQRHRFRARDVKHADELHVNFFIRASAIIMINEKPF